MTEEAGNRHRAHDNDSRRHRSETQPGNGYLHEHGVEREPEQIDGNEGKEVTQYPSPDSKYQGPVQQKCDHHTGGIRGYDRDRRRDIGAEHRQPRDGQPDTQSRVHRTDNSKSDFLPTNQP